MGFVGIAYVPDIVENWWCLAVRCRIKLQDEAQKELD
jgi:hypothetical protein